MLIDLQSLRKFGGLEILAPNLIDLTYFLWIMDCSAWHLIFGMLWHLILKIEMYEKKADHAG